jgi:hypothetical protein
MVGKFFPACKCAGRGISGLLNRVVVYLIIHVERFLSVTMKAWV